MPDVRDPEARESLDSEADRIAGRRCAWGPDRDARGAGSVSKKRALAESARAQDL